MSFFDIFHPPPTPPSKKWVSSGGGGGFWGGSRPKTHWGMRFLDKIMMLQGIKPTIQPLGVGYANRPKKAQNGGVCGVFPYVLTCLALISQPLRGDFQPAHASLETAENRQLLSGKGPHGGGGVTGGTRSSDLGPPPWARGSTYKNKVIHDPSPIPHIAAAIRKNF